MIGLHINFEKSTFVLIALDEDVSQSFCLLSSERCSKLGLSLWLSFGLLPTDLLSLWLSFGLLPTDLLGASSLDRQTLTLRSSATGKGNRGVHPWMVWSAAHAERPHHVLAPLIIGGEIWG
jgi:hypothetical protein